MRTGRPRKLIDAVQVALRLQSKAVKRLDKVASDMGLNRSQALRCILFHCLEEIEGGRMKLVCAQSHLVPVTELASVKTPSNKKS